jgi:hypothetical protein
MNFNNDPKQNLKSLNYFVIIITINIKIIRHCILKWLFYVFFDFRFKFIIFILILKIVNFLHHYYNFNYSKYFMFQKYSINFNFKIFEETEMNSADEEFYFLLLNFFMKFINSKQKNPSNLIIKIMPNYFKQDYS